MKLYHSTNHFNILSIFRDGLLPNEIGIVYLSPGPQRDYGDVILEVETGANRLTAFDDCREWEVLCWGRIPPRGVKEILKYCVGEILSGRGAFPHPHTEIAGGRRGGLKSRQDK